MAHTQHPRRTATLLVAVIAALGACTADKSGETDEPPVDNVSIEVAPALTVPRTVFCDAMTGLADRLETDNSTPAAPLVLETYRRVLEDAPLVIQDDMEVVIDALENGQPIPTDPPVTLATVPASTPPATTAVTQPTTPSSSSVSTSVAPDVGFNEATSPTERIANYVGFECRGTDNNPGPPATEPLSEPASTDG